MTSITKLITIPNTLSAIRVILTPVLFAFAYYDSTLGFAITFGVIILTDFFDGWLARKLNLVSEFGASIDSIADVFFYLILVPSLYILSPDNFEQAQWFILVGIFSLSLAFMFGFIKYKTAPSFHTWSAKMATIIVGPVILLWLGLGWVIAVKIFSIYLILVAIEQFIIIIRLKQWTSNIHSVFHLKNTD